jgi:hypothetical protein
MQQEIFELKQLVLDLNSRVKTLEKSIPNKISLADYAKFLNISRQSLRAFLNSNFRAEEDFYKINNKIYLDISILPIIKAHYDK